MANSAAHVSLTNTLVLALTQCQDQVRELEERAQTLTRLQHENEELRKALEDARAVAQHGDMTIAHRAELETLYQSDFDKQAQIDKLRQKLKIVKIKARQRGLVDAITSSPLLSSSIGQRSAKATPVTSSPKLHSNNPISSDAATLPPLSIAVLEESLSHHLRKRARSQSPKIGGPLRGVSGNTKIAKKNQRGDDGPVKRQRHLDRTLAAMPNVAEDGEPHLFNAQGEKTEHKTKGSHASVYERLHDLMSAPTPTRSSLLQTAPKSAPPLRAVKSKGGLGDDSSSSYKTSSLNKAAQKSTARFSIMKPPPMEGPEDEEPFRSRPLSKLDLSRFKLNPAVNDGLQYAYHEVVRGRQERKCLPGCTKLECCGGKFSVLAATLPSMPGMQGMSDDELLKGYLGPDSEEKIRGLTPPARTNLLHEARTKLVANLYGKMHRDTHERGRSPPGYWTTDMPGSQENEQFRDQARLLEREETRRRYQEAIKDGGRWMFADE